VKTTIFISTFTLLFIGIGSAQELRKDRWPGENTARYERAIRGELAERFMEKYENDLGRTFDAAYRRDLVRRLASLSLDKLREGESTDLVGALTLGDEQTELVYVPFAKPCRVIDTRIASGVLTTAERGFRVAGAVGIASQGGNPLGCDVPFGPADAVMINFVAVQPYSAGNLQGAAAGTPIPDVGGLLNYQRLTPNLNIANGVIFPMCQSLCGNDITLRVAGGSIHLVADVLGYFKRFPLEEARPTITTTGSGLHSTLTTTCTGYDSIEVDVPVPGKVWVRGTVIFQVSHFGTNAASFYAYLDDSGSCSPGPIGGVHQTENYIAISTGPGTLDGIPSGASQMERSFDVVFDAPTAGLNTYYLTGNRDSGGSSDSASLRWVTLTAVFFPNQPVTEGPFPAKQ
jgi:hypothetical protein